MKYASLVFSLLFYAITISLIWPTPAKAYLDPGTGSFLIQIILSVIFGSLFAIKLFYAKIKVFFTKIFSKNRKDS